MMGVLDWRHFFQLHYSWRKYVEIFQAGLWKQVRGSNAVPVKTWPAKSLPSDIGFRIRSPCSNTHPDQRFCVFARNLTLPGNTQGNPVRRNAGLSVLAQRDLAFWFDLQCSVLQLLCPAACCIWFYAPVKTLTEKSIMNSYFG